MNIKQTTYQALLLLVVTFIIIRCANPVAPQGGPKDEIPPTILKMDPPNYSALFDQEKLIVEFDEFVKLQGLNNQLMISPALEYEPRIRTKGKSVVIEIEEQLRDSTTYTFYFGDAIVDITESNPLSNFEYVFSTGSLIDSMAVKGTVINAFDMIPEDGVAVLLYTLDVDSIPIDSLPMLSRPVYVSRTNEKGEFELNNLRNVPYKLFALLDMNSNYLYDLPNEEIAYSDTVIMPAYLGRKVYIPPADTMQIDTMIKVKKQKKSRKKDKVKIENPVKNDSIVTDTSTQIIQPSNIDFNYKPHELFMFLEVDSTQQISKSSISKGSLITILLEYPCTQFQLNPLNFYPSGEWNLLETNKTNDTILCWVNGNMPDSLTIEFVADSIILDTLNFVLNKVNPNAKVDTTKVETAKLSANITVGKIELGQKLVFESEYPLINYDFSQLRLEGDTLPDLPRIVVKDSVRRHFYLNRELLEKTKYKLVIPDSALLDIKGRINDSIVFEFETKSKEEYATLTVDATSQDSTMQWIVQLIDSQDDIVSQRIIEGSQKINFEYLEPAKYKLKAILDENRNGIWDTGNYIMRRQPEKVIIYNAEIELRENWVTEQSWELK